jgi:uncharacterized protein (TIGR00369 family)
LRALDAPERLDHVVNEDQRLVLRFCDDPSTPLAVDTNPLALALVMVLVSFDRNAGRLVVRYTPGAQFIQAAGAVQGGAVGTMLDFAMGFLVMAFIAPEMTMATAQLSVSFQRAAREGTVTLNADLERCGRTTAFTRAAMLDADGQLVASATAVSSIFPQRVAAAAPAPR